MLSMRTCGRTCGQVMVVVAQWLGSLTIVLPVVAGPLGPTRSTEVQCGTAADRSRIDQRSSEFRLRHCSSLEPVLPELWTQIDPASEFRPWRKSHPDRKFTASKRLNLGGFRRTERAMVRPQKPQS